MKTLVNEFTVLLGVYDLNVEDEIGREEHAVRSVHMHPDWDFLDRSFDADIAVLVLEKEVTFGLFIQPICLIDPASADASVIASIDHGTVVGYGKSEDKSKDLENIPKKLEIPIHSISHCISTNAEFEIISSGRTFCGGYRNGTGVCDRDSGSGLFVLHNETYYLRGIISASLKKLKFGCDPYNYAIYTNMLRFYRWVNGISSNDDGNVGG